MFRRSLIGVVLLSSICAQLAWGEGPGDVSERDVAPQELSLINLPAWTAAASTDEDGDGVTDDVDNCTLVANPRQLDANGDGFGNACDADLNNDCTVDFADLALLRDRLFARYPLAYDLNGDAQVDLQDVGLIKSAFYQAPGPSGLIGICDPDTNFGDL